MPIETVRFDRVDHVHRHLQINTRRRMTYFDFQSGTQKRYAVPIPGRPIVESAMVVSAYLKKPGNWQSLVGWFNHTHQEMAVPSCGGPLALMALACALLIQLAWERPTHMVMTMGIGSIILIVLLLATRRFFFLRQVRRELRHCAENQPAPVPNPDSGLKAANPGS